MKTIRLLLISVVAVSLAACNNGGKLVPTSKKVNGPLGKFFEIVERDYKVNDNELNVEFKRIAEGGPKDVYSDPTFSLEIQDEDGNCISTVQSSFISQRDQLESVFSLGIDESASITFKLDNEKIKDAVKFKVSSKWNGGDSNSSGSSSGIDGTYELKGKVEKYPITMHLEIEGSQVNGTYFYDKKGPDAQLNLSGRCDGNSLDINETDENGTPTGHFKGTMNDGVFKGQFITNKGKSMPFAVTEGNVDDLSFDDIDIDSSSDMSSSSGSTDWDELLDSYERYVDDYIALAKKARNGDMSALSEYASVLQDANDLSEKIQGAKSEMSTSQIARYNKISIKLANAAQNMR